MTARELTTLKTLSLSNYPHSPPSCPVPHRDQHVIKNSRSTRLRYAVRFQISPNTAHQKKIPSKLEGPSTRVLEASLTTYLKRLLKTTLLVWTMSISRSQALLRSTSASCQICLTNKAQPKKNNTESVCRRTKRTSIRWPSLQIMFLATAARVVMLTADRE